MIAAPDGSGVRPVLKEPLTDATWFDSSPDSRSLAVVHEANGVRVLSIVDIEHGTMRTLDVNGLDVDYWVAWLPGTTSELLFGSRSGSGDSRAGRHLLDPGRWEWPDTRRAVQDGPRRVQRRRSRARRPNPHVLALGVGDAARAHPSARHRHQSRSRVEVRPVSRTAKRVCVHSPDGSQVLLSRNGTVARGRS